jgi:signal transduction histidine kinase
VRDSGRRLSREDLFDLVLGLLCLAVAIGVHLGGSEAVPANLEPSAFSVLLTALAVGPLVVRHRYPLTVLVLTLAGLLLLVATRNTVGASTLGCTVALYTLVAVAPRRRAVVGVAVMVIAVAVGLAMQPVDLSPGGAVVNMVIFTGAGVFGYTVRERHERYEAEVVSAQAQAARSATEERLRITRELHDIIGHAMSVMVVQAGVVERLIDTDPERARAAVAEIGDTGRRSMTEMRQVLDALREGDLDESRPLPREPLPTLAQVPDLVAHVESSGLRVSVTQDRDLAARTSLPEGLQLAAYRVLQEALTNCLAHAAADRAWVEVRESEGALTVVVTDDGRGGTSASGRTGQGLAGMRERVALYGGELVAGPRPEGGYRVEARFPLPEQTRPTGSLA